jgi:hypothetical protein
MSDFVNSVTEAQQKLHADMRRDSDPRWHLLPVEDKATKPPVLDAPCGLWLLAIPVIGLVLIVLAVWG